jgi:prevent-host-death family protein
LYRTIDFIEIGSRELISAYERTVSRVMSKRTIQLTVTEARERFADVLIDVAFRGGRAILLRHGRPLAALVPMEDLTRLQELDAEPGVEQPDIP